MFHLSCMAFYSELLGQTSLRSGISQGSFITTIGLNIFWQSMGVYKLTTNARIYESMNDVEEEYLWALREHVSWHGQGAVVVAGVLQLVHAGYPLLPGKAHISKETLREEKTTGRTTKGIGKEQNEGRLNTLKEKQSWFRKSKSQKVWPVLVPGLHQVDTLGPAVATHNTQLASWTTC